jgi:RNA recognition motif-containing protein
VEKVVLPLSKEDSSKKRDYGFVHFRDRATAVKAVAAANENKPELDGKQLQVGKGAVRQ